MIRRPLAFRHRARDPGGRLSSFGRVTWVHCPQCGNAAKSNNLGVSCKSCGYMTIQNTAPAAGRWAQLNSDDQRCHNCRKPLENVNRPTGRRIDGKFFVRVRCPHCRETIDYPARYGWPPTGYVPSRRLPLFMQTQVGGHTLWVDNLAHLNALEEYLGAKVRERGSVAGLTMMARLPRWMKVSTNRAKVLRGLAQLRELAVKSGINE